MDKLKQLLGSRKFWAAFVGLALVITRAYAPDFPIGEAELANLLYLLMAYILLVR